MQLPEKLDKQVLTCMGYGFKTTWQDGTVCHETVYYLSDYLGEMHTHPLTFWSVLSKYCANQSTF